MFYFIVFLQKSEIMYIFAESLGLKLMNHLSTHCLVSLILKEANGQKELAHENIALLQEFRKNLRALSKGLSRNH